MFNGAKQNINVIFRTNTNVKELLLLSDLDNYLIEAEYYLLILNYSINTAILLRQQLIVGVLLPDLKNSAGYVNRSKEFYPDH